MGLKHILYISPYRLLGGGATKTMYLLLKNLDRERYQPVVLSYECKREDPYIEKIEKLDIEVICLKNLADHEPTYVEKKQLKRQNRSKLQDKTASLNRRISGINKAYTFFKHAYIFLRHDLSRSLKLIKIVKQKKIDLIHLYFGSRALCSGILASRLTGVPCISHLHTFGKTSRFDSLMHHWIDYRIFVSNAVRDHWYAIQPFPKGTVIYNGLEYRDFESHNNRQSVREKFSFSEDDYVICNIGRIVKWKGQDVFLKALSLIKDKTPRLKTMIVGGIDTGMGEYYKELKRFVLDNDMSELVIFTRFTMDVPSILSAADLVVHSSSKPEPFGTVIYEAMAAGKPVIATNAGGSPEIIDHGQNGLLTEINNPQSMAEAIMTFYNDRKMANAIKENAREKVRKQFTVERFASETQSLYDSLLSQ